MNVFHIKYDELFSIDNLFLAWNRFRSGKAGKYDIMSFEHHLENNIFALYEELHSRTYKHSQYEHFIVFDKKKRDIHKACETRWRQGRRLFYLKMRHKKVF